MRLLLTDILSAFGLLVIAAGVAGLLWPLIGFAGIVLAGLLILVGSILAASRSAWREDDE